MSEDPALFTATGPRRFRGRLRRELDADVKGARDKGAELPGDLVAVCRILADRIDMLERRIVRPYDHIPLTGMIKQYGESRAQLFAHAATAGDPLTRALADFMAGDGRPPAPVGDPTGPVPAE